MLAFRRLGGLSAVVAILTVLTAIQMMLIVLGNVTDYETNHQFVVHVLAMDTTFKSPAIMWRAITSPVLSTIAYLAIIAWELVSAIVLLTAALVWMRATTEARLRKARTYSSVGWSMWLILFGGGFIAVGGEYFAMWESTVWNGLTPALQNFVIASVGLILLHMPRQADPAPSGPTAAAEADSSEQQ